MRDVGIASKGTRAILTAMQTTYARRFVLVSAGPTGTVPSPHRPNPPKHDPAEGFFMRNLLTPLVKAAFGKHYADLALMEDLVRDSGLDWTVIRPPRLTNGPLTGTYRIAYGQNLRHGLVVSRADVAHLMLRVLEEPETIKEVVAIAY
jgi:nucleoside-diphosphate-sugar epimerase